MATTPDAKVLLVRQSNGTNRIKAQGGLVPGPSVRFLLCCLMMLFSFTSCMFGKKEQGLSGNESDGSCAVDVQPHPRYFKFLASYCPDKKPGEPLLLAYIPDQSIDTDVFLELFSGTLSSVICAPGPILLGDKTPSPNETKPWLLDNTPTLLLWYQEGNSEANESFYIMDPTGFPMRAKSITLAEKNEFVIALAPQASLSQTPHFIYLKQEKSGEPQSLWMQPVKI